DYYCQAWDSDNYLWVF
nr:immunoglobulin light chain junction region [Macaca mulatta]